MALGAQRADVLRLIRQTGASFVGVGIVVGTLASIGVARLLASQLDLFRVTATDPVSFSVVIALLSVVAVAGWYISARRATRSGGRRVGEEGRSRWGACHFKKKKKERE